MTNCLSLHFGVYSRLNFIPEHTLLLQYFYFYYYYLPVVTLQKKLSSGTHKVPLTENRTVDVTPVTFFLGGGALHCFCSEAPKTLGKVDSQSFVT